MDNSTNIACSIDKKINTAQEKSELLYKQNKQKTTWQQKVDSLLDRMNELNGLLMPLHIVLLNLTIDIERDFIGFKQSQLAPSSLKKINQITAKLLALVRKSDLYPGVKTTYYLIKQENNYLRELLADRATSKELAEDAEMTEIMKETIRVIAKNKSLKNN
jgi:hypothetical protein